jgi:hypothetical protein
VEVFPVITLFNIDVNELQTASGFVSGFVSDCKLFGRLLEDVFHLTSPGRSVINKKHYEITANKSFIRVSAVKLDHLISKSDTEK